MKPLRARSSVALARGSAPKGAQARPESRCRGDPGRRSRGSTANEVDLDDPATTAGAVETECRCRRDRVLRPMTASFEVHGHSMCMCHSTVDDSSLQASVSGSMAGATAISTSAAIVALAPEPQPFVDMLGVPDVATVKDVLNSWGPGRYDAELNMDGKAMRPDGKTAATLMPSAFGLSGRQPSHMDRRLGHRHVLERLRGQHANVRQGHFHRCAS